ncbi:prepilin peptidase [Corynebacterium glaucum]|uniref:prepilin peptidase n=1 Tax=Corynebacterium glaucum TaxID=187491 RepID=UPI0025B304C8|nr:prepilin peptidase [Corynebacterium glaucum]
MGLGGAVLVAVCGVWSIALVLFDVHRRRLPDALTIPAGVLALVACVFHPLALWGLVWPAGYLLTGRGIGGGDIKLALPLGIAVAWVAGLAGVICAVALSGLFTALFATLLKARTLPHGPSMLAAAWAVVIVGVLWPHPFGS